jgi:hypothetical protein
MSFPSPAHASWTERAFAPPGDPVDQRGRRLRSGSFVSDAARFRHHRRRAARIARATADLANTADRHPADIFIEGNRQLVVERQFVSYRLQEAASGRIEVIVERVYGPGERRP